MSMTGQKIFSYPTEDHEALAKALGILPGERILDVGGGHNPFLYAQVVVDIDFSSGHHRDGSAIAANQGERQYIQADLSALPFRDKSFDLVVCIQVLEHTDDPAKACEELMRVARRGFLETPRKWTEYYAGHPTHRWLVDEVNETLCFEPIGFHNSPFLNFALPPLWDSPELIKALSVHRHIPCIQMEWKDSFRYEIREKSPELSAEILAERHYCFSRNLLHWMASADHGLYHAARAEELLPGESQYSDCHVFYLALSGKWMQAKKQGITIRMAFGGLLAGILLRCGKLSLTLFRRIINFILHPSDKSV